MHIISLSVHQHNDVCEGYRSDDFIIGLTNVPPCVMAPTLWNYAVCGQYDGSVGVGATVSLQCTCKTCINYLYNTCITCASPAVYLRLAGVQISHRALSELT